MWAQINSIQLQIRPPIHHFIYIRLFDRIQPLSFVECLASPPYSWPWTVFSYLEHQSHWIVAIIVSMSKYLWQNADNPLPINWTYLLASIHKCVLEQLVFYLHVLFYCLQVHESLLMKKCRCVAHAYCPRVSETAIAIRFEARINMTGRPREISSSYHRYESNHSDYSKHSAISS